MSCNKKEFCYRLRPMNDFTIDELNNNYLWFSKRFGFKDEEDANIGAFIEDTPQIERGLLLRYTEEGVKEIVKLMDDIGICCFTKELPSMKKLRHFPNRERNICIEYNKKKLEYFFMNGKYAMARPFNDIIYDKHPTKIETDGTYHILTKKHKDGCEYTSIYNIFSDIKNADNFFGLLLTRLNDKYKTQKEMRIILSSRNLDFFDKTQAGYKVEIPHDAICRIYIYNKLNALFQQKLESIDSLKGKIEYLNKNDATPTT